LIIAGDVFDSIDFRRLKKTHWKILSLIRHLSDKLAITWICGNHDVSAEIISHLLGVDVQDEYILESGNRKIMIIHGHVFDEFIDDHPILTAVADSMYNLLQRIDRTHYVARLAKKRSKTFIHCVDKIERRSREFARKRGCDAVVCGHTHHAVAKTDGDVHYFNSGCWTELPSTYLTVDNGVVTLCHHVPAVEEPLPLLEQAPETPAWRQVAPELAAS
jgi:UDP-2,3-diacylglucosamine pyrophosphatase LpxH